MPQDSQSHDSFLLAYTGNSLADLREGSHEQAKLLTGASKNISRLSSAYARAALYTSKEWDHTSLFKEQLFSVFIDVLSLFIKPSARYDMKILTSICYKLQVLFFPSHPRERYSCLKLGELEEYILLLFKGKKLNEKELEKTF